MDPRASTSFGRAIRKALAAWVVSSGWAWRTSTLSPNKASTSCRWSSLIGRGGSRWLITELPSMVKRRSSLSTWKMILHLELRRKSSWPEPPVFLSPQLTETTTSLQTSTVLSCSQEVGGSAAAEDQTSTASIPEGRASSGSRSPEDKGCFGRPQMDKMSLWRPYFWRSHLPP